MAVSAAMLLVTETVVDKIERILSRPQYTAWFEALWEKAASEYEFYVLAAEIYEKVFKAPLSFERWKKSFQKRLLFHPVKKVAEKEFVYAIVYGC